MEGQPRIALVLEGDSGLDSFSVFPLLLDQRFLLHLRLVQGKAWFLSIRKLRLTSLIRDGVLFAVAISEVHFLAVGKLEFCPSRAFLAGIRLLLVRL